MSRFDRALASVMAHEGGYVNHPKDPGGATNFGISLRFLKSMGHQLPDVGLYGDLDGDGDIDADDIKLIDRGFASDVYRRCWWDRYGYDRIINEGAAIKLLDFGVNMGNKRAVVNLQRAVRAASRRKVVDDGVLGPMTVAAVNQCADEPLTCAYMSECAGYYRLLDKPWFLKGWLNRAYNRDYLPF